MLYFSINVRVFRDISVRNPPTPPLFLVYSGRAERQQPPTASNGSASLFFIKHFIPTTLKRASREGSPEKPVGFYSNLIQTYPFAAVRVVCHPSARK